MRRSVGRCTTAQSSWRHEPQKSTVRLEEEEAEAHRKAEEEEGRSPP